MQLEVEGHINVRPVAGKVSLDFPRGRLELVLMPALQQAKFAPRHMHPEHETATAATATPKRTSSVRTVSDEQLDK